MKRLAWVALAAVSLLAVIACSSPSTSNPSTPTYTFPSGTGTGGTTSTVWWIKGSFDGWKGGNDNTADPKDGTRHFLATDANNANLLSLGSTVIKGLTSGVSVEFTLNQNNDTNYHQFVYVYSVATDTFADNGVYTLVDSSTEAAKAKGALKFNPAFNATAATYTILVDVAVPTAPVVKLVPGTAVAAADVAALAAGLKIKGDQFKIGWNSTAGTVLNNTVTFSGDANYLIDQRLGGFGFDSLDGFIKSDAKITSPITAGASATAVSLSSRAASNLTIGAIPFSDAIYTLVVTIDPAKSVYNGRYSLVVTLKDTGKTAWPPAPTTIFLNGDLNTAGWVDKGVHDPVTVTAGVATIMWKATKTGTIGFKFKDGGVDSQDWSGVGGGGIDSTGSTVAIAAGKDNIEFEAVKDTTYTITIDFTGGFKTTGKATVNIK